MINCAHDKGGEGRDLSQAFKSNFQGQKKIRLQSNAKKVGVDRLLRSLLELSLLHSNLKFPTAEDKRVCLLVSLFEELAPQAWVQPGGGLPCKSYHAVLTSVGACCVERGVELLSHRGTAKAESCQGCALRLPSSSETLESYQLHRSEPALWMEQKMHLLPASAQHLHGPWETRARGRSLLWANAVDSDPS